MPGIGICSAYIMRSSLVPDDEEGASGQVTSLVNLHHRIAKSVRKGKSPVTKSASFQCRKPHHKRQSHGSDSATTGHGSDSATTVYISDASRPG